ncbi:hypothetical protein BKA70DRAFT_1251242 [Coprinopsis sp. MPI-PUGE-AT-0042]|nr:hypothetical protein BKA70DRAFT_1251242 [Coprinopsis sp. MPI-PUGE-AT-0042]
MNGAPVNQQHSQSAAVASKQPKPPPPGPAPPAPVTAPPLPPTHSTAGHANGPPQHHHHHHHHHHQHGPVANGQPQGSSGKKGKRAEAPLDPATLYESLKNRIAALEEEEEIEEEEERQISASHFPTEYGINAIHAKYVELFAELKRVEREHAKEKQKLTKDKDAGRGSHSQEPINEVKSDENEDGEPCPRAAEALYFDSDIKLLLQLLQMKDDLAKRADRARMLDQKYRELPDIVVKVVCRYRAELFFKISRKTKLSRLVTAWTLRMEINGGRKVDSNTPIEGILPSGKLDPNNPPKTEMQFLFTHRGRRIDPDQTPEELGMEEGDEILAVEMMDLTQGGTDEWVSEMGVHQIAAKTLEDIFDGVVRDRLKEILRQYELRERHFECVIRSKELEVQQLRKDLEESKNGQAVLVERLLACCKEFVSKPSTERMQRLFTSLKEELERKGNRPKNNADESSGG